jgi:MFS family permease
MNVTTAAYLGSYTLSILGNASAGVALPLIVLQTTGAVLSAGLVAGATALPAFVAGLTMGVVIDRINRRTASVLTDLISAASLAALPLVDQLWGLNVSWFVLSGVIGSLGDVPGLTARDALAPGVLRRTGLGAERLVGLRESLGALALLVGPAAISLAAALTTCLMPRDVGALTHDAVPSPGSQTAWAAFRA